ncbi:MAG TPA: DegT/DnrJ/EryC1/StrS family aminotransferase [bacterium]|nr:DegT/DnrJ/EryC1/StrS family aminotransferase [bacterium]
MTAGPRPMRLLGVGDATIGDLEIEFVLDTLKAGRLSYGRYTASFEQEFAREHERAYAVFCNSGTSALQVALHALKERHGWADGDEVLVPALTFIASSNVVLQNRLQPVFVDIEPLYFGMDPAQIEQHITSRTRAIMPVHMFGQCADMEPIMTIARQHGLRVLEDSCEAMFVRHRGRPVGSWGDAACFSTYVAHLIVTGVGGLALTDDPDLAVMFRSLINHGRDGIYLSPDASHVDDPERLWEVVRRRFSFVHVGYSYRATEMEAALGLAQLRRKDHIISGHQRNAAYLTAGLRPFEEYLQLPAVRPGSEHAFMMYPIVIRDDRIARDALVRHLEERRVETRFLMPLLDQPVYRRLFGDLEEQYPVARRVTRQGFYVGCHQGLSREDIDYMIDVFAEFFARAPR